MKFECASAAAEVLGCDLEELSTAVFKHHLKQILAQVAVRGRGLPPPEESPAGTGGCVPFIYGSWGSVELCAAPEGVLPGEAMRLLLFRQWGPFKYVHVNYQLLCYYGWPCLSLLVTHEGQVNSERDLGR